MNNTDQASTSVFRKYLIPFALLLSLYLIVIGGGSGWLYMTARHAQTELVTTHILETIKPTIRQIETEHNKLRNQKDLSKLSNIAVNLYRTLPNLRQVSVRDSNKGYGVRLTSDKKLVDVELEPLSREQVEQSKQQILAHPLTHQLHHKDGPFFHVTFDLKKENNEPVQVDIAFDRGGLIGQIETSMQSLIHNIVIFSALGIVSLLFAVGLSIYISRASYEVEEHLQAMSQQVAIGKLSADLVHDLRNPLASIRANIKNLLITPNETNEIVAEMDEDLMRLEHKLSDFLKLTKPRNEPFTTVDINVLLQDVTRQCRSLFKEKQQLLILDMPKEVINLPVMVESLNDALVNLLVNAHKHTPKQGHIRLQVRNIGTQIEIVLEDDGAGINKDVLLHIFDPFFTTRTDGHGLGLAIVKRIIKAHNGTVSALNRPEGGARFTITLPINQQYE